MSEGDRAPWWPGLVIAAVAAVAVAAVTAAVMTVSREVSSPGQDEAWLEALEAAAQVDAAEEAAEQAMREAVAAKAEQVAQVLTRQARADGAVTVDDYVSGLGRTERQVDEALAALFAGAHVVVDYVTSTPAPIVTVFRDEDYKVTVNVSTAVAEVFTPLG